MADQERRGDDQHEHAWAELTWRNLAKIVIKFGFIPGFFCGLAAFGIGVWTSWYLQLALMTWKAFVEFWYLFLGFGLLTSGFFYANHWLSKRRKP